MFYSIFRKDTNGEKFSPARGKTLLGKHAKQKLIRRFIMKKTMRRTIAVLCMAATAVTCTLPAFAASDALIRAAKRGKNSVCVYN